MTSGVTGWGDYNSYSIIEKSIRYHASAQPKPDGNIPRITQFRQFYRYERGIAELLVEGALSFWGLKAWL
jgi:hypothetical protein